MQNAAFRVLGLRAVYVALRCAAPMTCPACFRSLARSGGGGNVTIPHKEARGAGGGPPAGRCRRGGGVQRVLERGRRSGRRQHRRRPGLLRGPRPLEAPPGPWLIVGTGGGARAAAIAAARAWRGGRDLVPLGGARRRVRAMVRRPGLRTAPAAACTAVINATPLGLRADDPLPLEPAAAHGRGVALDLVYAHGRDAVGRAPCGARVVRAADGRAHAGGARRRGARALVSRRAGARRGHARRGRCRASLSCACAGARALAPAGRRASCARRRSPRARATRWSVRSAVRAGEPVAGPLCRPLRPAAPSAIWTAGCAPTGPRARAGSRSAVWLDGSARAAVHRLKYEGWWRVADVAGRGDAGPRAIDRAGMLDTGSARRTSAAQPRLQPERAARRRARRAHRTAGRDRPICCGARETQHPDGTHAGGAPGQRGRRLRARAGVRGLEVVLVDDVFTTGATLAAAAAALLAGQERRAWTAVTFARALEPVA